MTDFIVKSSVEEEGDFTYYEHRTKHGVARQTCRYDKDYNTTFDGFWTVTMFKRAQKNTWTVTWTTEEIGIKMICENLFRHEVAKNLFWQR